jgi:Xaa-Pro dipeptidase
MVPLSGAPVLICPSFEIERMKRNAVVSDVRGWEEQQNPWKLVKKAGQEMKPAHRNGSVAVEQSTSYQSFLNLEDQLSGWKFNNAAPVTERLRIIKSPEEVALIREAIAATEASIAATFSQLAVGMTERDVATLLSREMASRGSPGGGLVQFGPSSALPHGGPSAGALQRETVVLIDAGSRVAGVHLGHHAHDLVWRRARGRVQESVQHGPRRADGGDRKRQAVHYDVPGRRPRRPEGHYRRRLRAVLHAPARARHGHGRP